MIRDLAKRFLPARVKTYRPRDVTTLGVECDPRDAGVSVDDVEAIWKAVERLYRTGMHPALALCLRRRGQVLIDRAIGHSHGNSPDEPEDVPKRLATPKTRFGLMSGSKSVTAMLTHLLDERGALHLDDRVVDYIPEFGKHGKSHITIRHVLLHRAGIPSVGRGDIDLDLLSDPEGILAYLCEMKPTSRAGSALAYHAITGGFILGEIIARITGKDLRTVLQENVTDPLGMDAFNYGIPKEQLDTVAIDAFTGVTPRMAASTFLERSLGVTAKVAVSYANDPRFRMAVIPSGNVITTANDACRFMELLRCGGELDGVRVFEERTVRRAVSEQSWMEIDRILMMPIRYSMGFMLGGKRFSLYGPNAPHAYGHLGFTNILFWADPEREISVALLNSGKPVFTPETLAWFALMRRIAQRMPRR